MRVEFHRQDVDTLGSWPHPPGGVEHPPLLLLGDLDERIGAVTSLDLGGNDHPVDPNQQVDLTAADTHVARDERGAAAAEEGEGDRLAESA